MRRYKYLMPLLLTLALGSPARAGSITSNGFSENEQAFLSQAVGWTWSTILSHRVEACARNAARLELLSGGIGAIYGESFVRDGALLYAQLAFLRRAAQQSVFPDLHVNAYEKDDFSYGLADLDLVKIFNTRYDGSFRIALNRTKMAVDRSVANWGSVIGHEMLHNISHTHPRADDVGLQVAYDDDYQINAFQACIASGGTYRPNNTAIVYRCGGRETQ